MLRIVLLSCLVAGGLSAKLPQGPEHRSLGDHSGSATTFTSTSSSAGGSLGNGGFGSASFSNNAGTLRASAGFNGNSGSAGFSSNGGAGLNNNGGAGFNNNGGAGFNNNGGAGFNGNGAASYSSNNGATFNGNNGFDGNNGGFNGNNGGFNGAFNGNNGGFNGNNGVGGQFDDGRYRPDEVNGEFDDGTWKPELYAGDDGLYRDGQYTPNTDASYQFQFDAGDHGRDEAADRDGEVQGSFYAVHPDGLRRDVEFSAGRDGFVVTRDESVQGPVPEYALRQAERPRKEYPPAEIITSLSPDGIYHWEYDAGDSARSEDINLNTNYYEGDFSFVADDDQNRYEVRYKAGAGIGFVPEGDHLPMQVQETPEVAEAKAAFLEKFAEAQAEALQRPNAYRGNGVQSNNGNGFQSPRPNNGNGFQRDQTNNGNGFRRAQNNNGNGFQRDQTNNGNGFQRAQNNGNGFQRAQNNNRNGFQRAQTKNGNGFQKAVAGFQRDQAPAGNGFQNPQPIGASSQTRYSSVAAPQNDAAVHPSQMVSGLALGGHMKQAAPSQINDTYLPPNN
ncbi:probable cyclin-dependent serine/threonine-protein kinase DDB_G0292550 [Amphibalanus amphitrite]|uniref:probable cyclin-dependent serine/threonine-protein kinase DDB_G0292550 n=1 Tax=Amphibalanus amphitrite TaxID=1232801 RepID=UPI001C901C4B|nr:probable cyclin-dependent serine/threonine-protein kinase DDB_G0292550 [Amphibalanus amphitrite]